MFFGTQCKRHLLNLLLFMYIYLCGFVVNSVRKRVTTDRPFTFESNWQDVGTLRQKRSGSSKKKKTPQTQNTTSRESRTNSNQVTDSRVTRSQVALSSSAGRNSTKKTAASDKKSSSDKATKASHQNPTIDLVQWVPSESADRARHSTKSGAGLSNADANSTQTETTSVTEASSNKAATGIKQSGSNSASRDHSAVSTSKSTKGLKNSAKSKDKFVGTGDFSINDAGTRDSSQTTVKVARSNSHDSSHQNSGASSTRAQQRVKSRPANLAAETILTEPYSISAIVAHGEAYNTHTNDKTVGTGTPSLHLEAASSGMSSVAGRKNVANKKSANIVANEKTKAVKFSGVSGGSKVGGSAATGDMHVVNNSLSSVAVSQQSVIPLSHEQASNAGNGTAAASSVDVVTNASSNRIPSVSQDRQTGNNIRTSAASETLSLNALSIDKASDAANMDVVSSGKTVVTNGLNAASARTRSAAHVRQTSAVAKTGSTATTSQLKVRYVVVGITAELCPSRNSITCIISGHSFVILHSYEPTIRV